MATYSRLFRNLIASYPVLLILLSLLIAMSSSAATTRPKAPKASCRIEVDNAHISTSLLKNLKRKFVKVNARSICNVPQELVTLTIEIHKMGALGNHLVASHFTNPADPRSAGMKVVNEETKRLCVSGQQTKYFGVAYSKAFIQGKWQYAGKTLSPKTIPLRCGT